MEFELNFLAPVCDICVFHALHKYRPRMRVVGWHAFWLWIRDGVEGSGCGTVDKWAEYCDAFYSFLVVGWCHVVLRLKSELELLSEDEVEG